MMPANIVVASVPFTDTTAPMMAPALFKGILNDAGFACTGFDLNGTVLKLILDDPYYEDYLRFFYYETIVEGLEEKIKSLFVTMAGEILRHKPTIICLSLLHYQCQVCAKWLCFYLKKFHPEIPIVIGGAGVFGNGLTTNESEYATTLKNHGLIDYYISGDGDIALVELVKGNVNYPGINNMAWKPLEDLNSVPYPNYDDYDFEIYKSPFIGILGSRGCVRQCTFCDIHEYWEKFKYRTGENIFKEMLHQNQRYGIKYFKFQDSLINGNVKEYNKLIELLSNHNRNNPDNRLSWASYFIFRPQSQMPEEQWKLTAESGAMRLHIGIESLVEKNRYHLKKKFNDEDINYGLDMAKKYGINLGFLILIGYVTETEEDHLQSLKWLQTHKHYANDPIQVLSIGGTLAILPGTWLFRNQKELGVEWLEGESSITSGKNHLWKIEATGNDYPTRLRRLTEFMEEAKKQGFTVVYSVVDPQKELENEINKRMETNESSTTEV